jgi:hypothetical protein
MGRWPVLARALFLIVAVSLLARGAFASSGAPPAGLTGFALDGRAELAWQPVAGATGYDVYRGASPTTITTPMTPAGVTGTSFVDTSAANATIYYYTVRSVVSGSESGDSQIAQVKPVPRGCSTGNPIALENCYPGSTDWLLASTPTVAAGGIEGFATATSINLGESIGLKVNTAAGVSYDTEIYRSGYYGGSGARLVSAIRKTVGTAQPACTNAATTTGLFDCSNWSTSLTLTTTSSWPTGVYLVRLVRNDNGAENEILFVVRDDSRATPLLYGIPFSTYEAYNNYGGKSLYSFNSTGSNTVAGTPRAVKVSFDRPFEQARTAATANFNDWYTRTDYEFVSWLERSGYDVSYQSVADLELSGPRVKNHKAYMLGAHDEYYSAAMRSALQQARDAGVNLFDSGANAIYWKIRFENGPNGGQNRIEVCYKSVESGVSDPSGISTSTWRDPAGPNNPENGLLGTMYIGDNSSAFYPFKVSATDGSDRVYRYTGLDTGGASTTIGTSLVGWEWDARVANGFEPAGVKTLASSAVTGNLIQNNGGNYITGSAISNSARYTAPSGAIVFATGSNQWARGLALNAQGVGEPDVRIQQTATNVLEDMGVVPQTPAANVRLDDPADPTVSSTTPTDAQANVAIGTTVSATFPTSMDATTITTSSFTLKRPDGTTVTAAVAYDGVTKTATLSPSAALANGVTYTARLATTVRSTVGRTLAYPYAWVFTTIPPPTTLRINAGGGAYTSSSGTAWVADTDFTGGSTNSTTHAITGTTDQTLYKAERWGAFSYTIPVTPGTYDVRLHFVEMYYTSGSCIQKRVFSIDIGDTLTNPDLTNLDICNAVGAYAALVKTISAVQVTDGFLNVQSIYGSFDDPEIAAIEVIPSGTGAPPATPTVTSNSPANGATGVGVSAPITAGFSTAMDGATITATSFTLKKPDGTVVPATVSYDASSLTATLTPSATLANSTTYTSTLTTAVKSSSGAALANPYTWSFTTGPPGTPTAVRINAGGGAYAASSGATFVADTSFTGGSTNSTTAAVTGTSDPALYKDERWGGFSYAIPVVNGTYDLKLHFVEMYYVSGGCIGKRVFSIDIGDTATNPDVPNLDVCAAAGGPNIAYVKTITGVQVSDGVLDLKAIYGSADDPEIAAIEIVPSSAPPPGTSPTVTTKSPIDGATGVSTSTTVTATFSEGMDATSITASSFTLKGPGGTSVAASVAYDPATLRATLTPNAQLTTSATYTANLAATIKASDGTPLANSISWTFTTSSGQTQPSTVRVNAGGGAFTSSTGTTFLADSYFTGGGTFSTTSQISGTNDQPLYKDERWGTFSYAIPVVNGTYDVKLHFVEMYYTSVSCVGKRIFSIDIADTPTNPDLQNLDVCSQAGGANTALVKTVAGVSVTDGVLNISSIYGTADDPEIAAIEVVPSSGPPPPPPDPLQVGQWSAPVAWPLVAVHMSLLPTGNVVAWDGFAAAPNSQRVWNPSNGTFTPVPYGVNIFCSGHVLLADGRTLVVGGHQSADVGIPDTSIFDSSTNSWTAAPNMSVGRWYPTATELGDGRVLAFSGDNIIQNRPGATPSFSDASVNSLPEIYDPVSNSWTDFNNATLTSPLYPMMFLLGDGRVLDAGPDTTTRIFNPSTGSWSTIGTSPFDGMSAVMYQPGKIMKAGSWADPDFNGSQTYNTTASTAVLDMNQGSPAWRSTASMAFPRAYENLTLLPDGTVLASGGMTTSDGVDLSKAVLPAEIWDPTTETWRTVAGLQNGREYHSTALLLPDGRVLMAGGGQLPGTPAVNQTNAEIYSPPYLFKGTRPTITSAPATVQYNSTFTVQTPDASSIQSVALIRTPSVTHAFDQNQRFQNLSFTQSSGSLTVTAPLTSNLAPPGYYMLFILNTNGVPSVARFVRFGAPSEDIQAPTAPSNLTASGSGGAASLTWTASNDNVGVTNYSVYRSTTSGFTPSLSNRIAQVAATSYMDSGLAAGTYYYVVKAQDAAGNLSNGSNEASASVTSGDDTTPPTVSLTAPSAGSTVNGTVTVSANASDNVGIAGVQFKLDGANLGAEDTTAPYFVSWDTTQAANGSHALTAVARDAAQNTTTSSGLSVTVDNAAPPPPTGLVAAYSFDQGTGTTVPDASGNGNTGTVSNTSWSLSGKYGGALSFNGTSSLVSIKDSSGLHLSGGMTLEAWVNTSLLTNKKARTVLIKENAPALQYALYANTDTNAPSGNIFTTAEFDTRGTATVPVNTWTFLAATYDGLSLSLYLNGTLVSTKPVIGSMSPSTGKLRIGGNTIWNEWFKGLIDEIRIYNRALSVTEIQADMNTRVGS